MNKHHWSPDLQTVHSICRWDSISMLKFLRKRSNRAKIEWLGKTKTMRALFTVAIELLQAGLFTSPRANGDPPDLLLAAQMRRRFSRIPFRFSVPHCVPVATLLDDILSPNTPRTQGHSKTIYLCVSVFSHFARPTGRKSPTNGYGDDAVSLFRFACFHAPHTRGFCTCGSVASTVDGMIWLDEWRIAAYQ